MVARLLVLTTICKEWMEPSDQRQNLRRLTEPKLLVHQKVELVTFAELFCSVDEKLLHDLCLLQYNYESRCTHHCNAK